MREVVADTVLIAGSRRGQLYNELIATAPGWARLCLAEPRLDITDRAAVDDFVDTHRPRLIINAAAYTAVDKAESEPELAYAVNQAGVQCLVAAARRVDAHLLQVSTDFVFGAGHGSPIPTDASTAPVSVYGSSKLGGERAVLEGLPHAGLVMRTAWVYAAQGNNFMRTMLRLMNERDELGIVADQIGAPTSARSLALALWQAAEHRNTGIMHYTNAGVASWYDFAVAIHEEASRLGLLARAPGASPVTLVPLRTSDYPTPAARPAYSVLDTWTTRSALNLQAVHWREELCATLHAMQATESVVRRAA